MDARRHTGKWSDGIMMHCDAVCNVSSGVGYF